MADITGVIGVCLGGLSFIFDTVPTMIKRRDAYKSMRRRIREFKPRLALCHSRLNTLKQDWRIKDHYKIKNLADPHGELADTLDDVEEVCQAIDTAIQKHTDVMSIERRTWQQMRISLQRGEFQLPKDLVLGFGEKLRLALWKKDILEDWVSRLEQAIIVIGNSLEQDFHKRTAGAFSGPPSAKEVRELGQLTNFIDELERLATRVYDGCTTISKTGNWELQLPTPGPGHDVSDWMTTKPIKMKLRFLVGQDSFHQENFEWELRYQKEDPAMSDCHLEVIQRTRVVSQGRTWNDSLPAHIVFAKVDLPRQRTLPLGQLLWSKPQLFLDFGWRMDRASVIYGILRWVLLLWNSSWFEELCCFGLTLEIPVQATASTTQFLCPRKHGECGDHTSRLRNLGVVWASIILGTLIRPARDGIASKFEIRENRVWKHVFRGEINERILDATSSIPLHQAIDFCLDPESPQCFEPGYWYIFLEKIHKPIMQWYRVYIQDSRDFASVLAGRSWRSIQNTGWPMEALG